MPVPAAASDRVLHLREATPAPLLPVPRCEMAAKVRAVTLKGNGVKVLRPETGARHGAAANPNRHELCRLPMP